MYGVDANCCPNSTNIVGDSNNKYITRNQFPYITFYGTPGRYLNDMLYLSRLRLITGSFREQLCVKFMNYIFDLRKRNHQKKMVKK